MFLTQIFILEKSQSSAVLPGLVTSVLFAQEALQGISWIANIIFLAPNQYPLWLSEHHLTPSVVIRTPDNILIPFFLPGLTVGGG